VKKYQFVDTIVEKMSEDFARAIQIGNVEKVKELVDSGIVEINSRLPRCFYPTALMHATSFNQCAIVQYLLQNNALLDEVDDQGKTACYLAFELSTTYQYPPNAANTSRNIFSLLLAAGSSLSGFTEKDLCYCASTSTTAIQALLDRRVVIRNLRGSGMTALHMCIRDMRDVDTLKMLVDICGIDIDARDFRNASCVHFATAHHNSPALLWLICRGADVNSSNDLGMSVLHYSTVYNNAILLLAAGAFVHEKDFNHQTPILAHAQAGRRSVVYALLAAGADLDAADLYGDTARLALARLQDNFVDVDAVSKARKDITKKRLDFVRYRALQVCIGLQSLSMPALQICEILLFACGPLAPLVSFHHWWKIVTMVKHFQK
jgi:ankyrin repeat protein